MKFKKILHHNKLSYYDNNNADDELSLIHPKNKKVKIAYGTLPGGKIKHKSAKYDDGDEVCERKSGLFGLFRYSTKSDKLLMFVGILFSVAHGFGFPLLALVFGQMTNTFVIQATQGTHSPHSILNSTVNEFVKTQSDIVTSTTMVSTSIYPSETPTFEEKFGGVPLSSDEFTAYMSRYSLYYLCIGLAVLTTAFAQTVCWELAAERQVQHLHTLFFGQVLRQDIGWYDVRSRSSGDLTVKLADDLERIREGIGSKFSMVIQYVSTFFSGITVGLIANWRLTCAILCVGPFLIGASAYVARYTASVAAREQLKYSIAGGVAEEVLNAIRTVAAFGGESKEIKRYDRALDEGRRMAMSKYYIMSSGVAIVFFLMYASFGFAFWYGAQLVAGGVSTPGSVFTVFFSVMAGAFSIGNALPFLNAVGTAIGAASTIFGVIDRIPNIDPYSRKGYIPKKPNSLTGTTGHIIFNGVYFSYPARPEVQVLNGLNMEIPTGKTVALVGTSGAGKSTIVSLLLRFYDPTCGEVLLDGVPLKDYNLRWLRNQIGVVSQEPVLFGMSIEDNIKFGCGGIVGDGDDDDVNNVSKLTTADVIKAAELANAHKFIKALPNGYKTMVGDRGAQLSGGQKQRIAIARAIVRDPKILLLDEATSALDAHSEGIVQDALDQAMKGRTTIIIAHRLSTIRNANIIYTFKNGVIAEAGDHNELMAMRGLYHNLVMTQVATTQPDVDVNTENNNVDNSLVLKTEQSENNEEAKTEWKKMECGYQSSGFLKTINNIKESKHDLSDDQNEKTKLKETDTSGSLMWRLFKLNAPEWCWLLAGISGCALTGFIMPVFAFFYGEVFSTFTLEGEEMKSATMFWTMMFFGLAFFSAFAFFVQIVSMTTAAEKLVARIRLITFQNLLRQSVGWFDVETNSPGRLITRLARDAPLIKHVSGLRAGHLVSVSVTLATAVCIAFLYGWKLASLLLIGVPLIAGASYKQTQIIRRSQLRDFKLMDSAGRVATECVSNVKTVQSLSKEKMFLKLYADYLVVPFKEAKKHALIYSVVFSLSQAIIFVMYAAAFRFGAYLIQIGDMTPTDVYRVFFALAFCATTAGQISAYIRDYNKARYASECLFKLIETKSEIDSDSSIGIRPVIHGKVTFDSVHFKYLSRPDYNVLRGISFTVEPGQTLALVGESGCGKSTIISLLERFYDPIQGKVMIDDFNTRSINIKHLRNNIGLVTQEPVLFNCSIKENILYGVQSIGENDDIIDMDNVIRAAKAANIHNFIVNLPQGYDTQVGRGGCKLSGGQKQRIAIARALIRDPKILLLDEATSALDTESEKIVQEALDYARRGRTCITVAHRLSTIQNADIIAVLHHGVIVEQGTHEELFNKQQRYYQLIKRQSI